MHHLDATALPQPSGESAGRLRPAFMNTPDDDAGRRSHDPLERSIIRSKVLSPPVRADTLERPRLLDWLTTHLPARLKIIAADAGYGKTTLLADFARRTPARCVWYRLEDSDRDWVTFINYVIAALREIHPGFAPDTASLLSQMAPLNPSLDVVLGSLVSELSSIGNRPTMLILDDFHLVDDSPNLHAILARLFERSPSNLTFAIAARGVPTLRIGRLKAAGEVAQLSTADLRFSLEETAELFAVAYGHPLEPDLVSEVDARLEGWGACLQLVYASLRSRRPSEERAFIQTLSGADRALYGYLAEEVLARLNPIVRRVLLRASLLDRIVPELVEAILSADEEPTAVDDVARSLAEADELGLMSRSSSSSSSARFHPLLRDFLLCQLEADTSAELRTDMHLCVARAAESTDWLAACHHYARAHQPADAVRVLATSAMNALGSGRWPDASRIASTLGDQQLPAPVQVVRARHLIAENEYGGRARDPPTLRRSPRGTQRPSHGTVDHCQSWVPHRSSVNHVRGPDSVGDRRLSACGTQKHCARLVTHVGHIRWKRPTPPSRRACSIGPRASRRRPALLCSHQSS